VRPKAQRPSRGQIRQRVEQLLELVQLGGLGGRYPAQLSGGQKQRVALARALAIEPRVLLLDEPFGALDAKVRKDLRRWLRKLHRETGYTTIFVTHDQEEALELADRVVVMNRGQIEQVGTVDQVYDFPNTPFVFDFLGAPNVLPGEVRDGYVYLKGASAPIEAAPGQAAGEVDIYARPADFRVVDSDPAALEGQVVETHRYGILVRLGVQLRASGASIEIEIPNPDPEMKVWDAGDPIRVRPAHFSVFPRSLAAPAPAAATPAEEAQLEHSTSERTARMR
jgi:sulfate transport system ATP-binding protein